MATTSLASTPLNWAQAEHSDTCTKVLHAACILHKGPHWQEATKNVLLTQAQRVLHPSVALTCELHDGFCHGCCHSLCILCVPHHQPWTSNLHARHLSACHPRPKAMPPMDLCMRQDVEAGCSPVRRERSTAILGLQRKTPCVSLKQMM